jgi:putative Flp pilus-assembly TadE/G-like protein
MRQISNCWLDFRTKTHSERGITLYVAAAGMFVLLGFIALAVDMGMLYQVRNDTQNIADAAALAGAREAFLVPNSNKTQAATEAAKSAARANYTPVAANDIRLRDGDIQVVDTSGEHTVRVTVRRTAANGNPVRTFFAPIVGFPTVDITATATAEAYIPDGTSGGPRFGSQCIKPWLLPDINPNTGQPYAVSDIGTDIIIKGGDPQTDIAAPGQFYPLDLQYNGILPSCPSCGDPASNNTGANLYQSNIACCNGNTVVCGDTRLNLQTGNMVGPTQSGVLCLIHQTSLGSDSGQDVLVSVTPLSIQYGSNHPGGAGGYGTSSEALVIVPVYDPATNPISPGQGSYPSVLVNKMIQVFIRRVRNPQGTVDAAIINVITCASSSTGSPSSGTVAVGGPLPLRLVRN